MLEWHCHKVAWFVTLTYNNEYLPGDNNLNPDHAQDWLKRLREYERSRGRPPLRFFLCGEYGGKRGRPHYHALLFGGPQEAHVGFVKSGSVCGCALCSSWRFGNVFAGDVSQASIQYTAGYVEKGITRAGDPWLGSRVPEFSRMSLRPGIGAEFVDKAVLPMLQSAAGQEYVRTHGDVFGQVRVSGRLWPLGRYLRRRLRAGLGVDLKTPDVVLDDLALERWVEIMNNGGIRWLEGKREQVNLRAQFRARINVGKEREFGDEKE